MIFVLFALAYFIGTIPFGLLLTRIAGLGDIRKVGSGNIGATNVMRTGHKGLGVLTLLLDGGKGALAVWIATWMHLSDMAPVAGFWVVIGHIFPIWLGFKGGKGVATAIGVLFALHWMLGAAVCIIWLLAFLMMRISAVASMLSIGFSPIVSYILGTDAITVLCLVLATLIIITHRGNIMRLLQGKENTFNKKVP